MLLTKLKITFCAAGLMLLAGIGATNLTYRVTAQEPRQGVTQASRTQSDELEALRLEIEALRKSLQATRERVKSVELEVTLLKRQPAGQKYADPRPQGSGKGDNRAPSAQPPGPGNSQPGNNPFGGQTKDEVPDPKKARDLVEEKRRLLLAAEELLRKQDEEAKLRRQEIMVGERWTKTAQAVDPLTQAEAALAKLRKNPSDKEAAEALERALQRLKEKEKAKEQQSERKYDNKGQ